MSDGKVQPSSDLIETQQQTIPEIKTKQNQKNIRKTHHTDLPRNGSRRSFMGKAGGLTAMAVAAAIVPLQPLLGGKESKAEASDITYSESNRSNSAFNYRKQEAQAEKI